MSARTLMLVACILIPPGIGFVIYGILTEESIGKLFMAGFLPGIMLAFLFILAIYIQCRLNPSMGPRGSTTTMVEKIKSLGGTWGMLLLFFIVMGGIYFGIFTPTEGASCGVFVVILIGLANRQLKWQNFLKSLRETMMVSAMIMLMIIGAMFFGAFTTTTQIPNALSQTVAEFAINRYIIMGLILFIYLLAGFVLDIYAILVITLPIFFPIVESLGFDALHFVVLAILTIMLGSVSPSFGIVVFAIGGMNRDVSIYDIFSGVMPFFITMILALIILLLAPEIATVLPDYMFPYR